MPKILACCQIGRSLLCCFLHPGYFVFKYNAFNLCYSFIITITLEHALHRIVFIRWNLEFPCFSSYFLICSFHDLFQSSQIFYLYNHHASLYYNLIGLIYQSHLVISFEFCSICESFFGNVFGISFAFELCIW